jgi:ubiquinol-cytochrome c reductase cytochrome c subunit
VRPARRPICLVGAALAAAGALVAFAAPGAGTGSAQAQGGPQEQTGLVAEGRGLFEEGCASCHGQDARGIEGTAPSLYGAGAAAADFYLSTGRMPLDDPSDQPVRSQPRYPPAQIDALVAYVGSLGGPRIPDVDPALGDLRRGLEAFTSHCAGCHQVAARGGIVTGAFAPSLTEATPTELAEAVRVGPYLMPKFGRRQIDEQELDSIARYVELSQHPVNDGGWAIGNLGPIPEGMIAWLLAIVALLLVARVIGERTS